MAANLTAAAAWGSSPARSNPAPWADKSLKGEWDNEKNAIFNRPAGNHGDSDPKTKYDIKIAIYRDIPLQEVKERFPVVKESKKDYRYVEYNAALKFLDKNILEHKDIDEQWAKDIVNRLSKVRNKIVQELEEKNWPAVEPDPSSSRRGRVRKGPHLK